MQELIAKIQNHPASFFPPAPVVAAADIARRMLKRASGINVDDLAHCFVAGDVTIANSTFLVATPRERLDRGLDYWIAADPDGPPLTSTSITNALSALSYLSARVPGYEDDLTALRTSIEASL